MKARLHVQTPPGQARGAEKKLRGFLLATQAPTETGVKDDGFYWELDLTYKQWVNLEKRVHLFQSFSMYVMDMKILRKAVKTLGASPDDIEAVKLMFQDGTRVEIIKNATAEEIVEGTTTWWEKFKTKFRRPGA